MITLVEKTWQFHREDDKTNVCVDFVVPEGFEALRCECAYSPKRVDDQELAAQAIAANIGKYVPRDMLAEFMGQEKHLKKERHLVNLITFSLDFGNRFVGCAHRHTPSEAHIISGDGSSPGFFRQRADAGDWRAVINIHSITSDEVTYSLKISACSKEELNGAIQSV